MKALAKTLFTTKFTKYTKEDLYFFKIKINFLVYFVTFVYFVVKKFNFQEFLK